MAKLPKTFGQGGAHLIPGASGDPDLSLILRDIITDLGTLRGGSSGVGAAITAPALPVFTDPPTAGEMAALRTLVNQIRAALVAGGGGGALLSSNA